MKLLSITLLVVVSLVVCAGQDTANRVIKPKPDFSGTWVPMISKPGSDKPKPNQSAKLKI
jgi:hypothetical protein